MKKSILAVAGLAAVAGAVAPVAGVFATVTGSPIKDTITVSVDASCTFGGGNNTTAVTLTSGKGSQADATAYTVNCNTAGGWNVKARGTDGAASPTARTTMVHGTDSSYTIATAASGNGWGFSIASTGTGTISGSYNERSAVPSTATLILSGDTTVDTTFTPTYYVDVPTTQAAGTYTGYVEYTLTDGAQS